MLYQRPRPARRGQATLRIVTAVLFLLFTALTVYQVIARNRDRADAERPAAPTNLRTTAPAASADDWPQWRGPRRDGISTETGLLGTWPAAGPRKLWEAATGEGFSSVVVARGRAFTLVQSEGNEALVAWDAATGAEIWRYTYPCRYTNPFGNGPRSTPTIAGEHIFTVGATGLMHCLQAFTANPALVWKKDLLTEFAAPEPQWGLAFSPLVEGDLVFIQPGGPAGNSIAALNKETGTLVWKKLDHPASYSSLLAATLAGQRQVLFFTGTHLVAVTPETGALLWELSWPTANHCNIATPICVDDYVFISSGYDQGCTLLQIEHGAQGYSARPIYKNRRMRNHFSTSVLHRGHLYGFDDATLVCLDFATSQVRWKERGFDRGSLLIADDKLIIYGANGIVALADADPTAYRERSRFVATTQQASCWSVPTVAAGRLYIRDQTKVTCYDVNPRREPQRELQAPHP